MSIGVYKIINNLNGKYYIGRSIDIESRMKDHFGVRRKNPRYIDRVIQEVGVENFSYEILEECNIEDLNEKEKYYIDKFDARNSEKGYNIRLGGTGEKVYHKIIDVDSLEIWSGVKECSDNTGIDGGTIVRLCNHMYGSAYGRRFMYLDEYEEKGIVEFVPKKILGRSKKLRCIDTNEIFESCHDAGRKLNLNFRLISDVCRGTRETTGGLRFEYID